MKFDLPGLPALQTESDVEQKLIYPMLVADETFGFGIAPNEILTKRNIKRLPIGKGKDRKSYFPDYLVHMWNLRRRPRGWPNFMNCLVTRNYSAITPASAPRSSRRNFSNRVA